MAGTEFPDLPVLVLEIREAADLDAALSTLAAALDRTGFEPVHVSLSGTEADGKLRVLGLWSAMPSRFEVGQIISPHATTAMTRNIELLRAGKPIRVHLTDDDFGLMGDLAKQESVAGWVIAPVATPVGVTAILALASASDEALDRADLTRVHALATMLGHWMLRKPPKRRKR